MTRNATILVIGPFPPPVHGFSAMTERLAEYLETTGSVQRFDTSSSAAGKLALHAVQIGRVLGSLGALVKHRMSGGQLVSIGCNGGIGQAYNLAQVALARLLGLRVSLHHHSYGYIDRPSGIMRAITRIGGDRLSHVFLAEPMQRAFQRRYPAGTTAAVVPNALFVPAGTHDDLPLEAERLVIGMISNLSRSKGLYDFLETARRLRRAGLPVEILLAGPVAASEDKAAIEVAQGEGLLDAVGALYGVEKDAFFAKLDLFLFPTRYAFEAQPTVIYEALAAGVPVIAFDRGCIEDQVGDCLCVLPQGADFSAEAERVCRDLLALPLKDRRALRRQARARHQHHGMRARQTLERLFDI